VEPDAGEGGAIARRGRIAVGSVWRVMAERTARAWQEAPQFVLSRRRPALERVSIAGLLVKICAEALRRHPRVTRPGRAEMTELKLLATNRRS
jgi:hypothetical protein